MHAISGAGAPVLVRLPRKVRLGDDEFRDLCQINPDLRIEMDREGSLVIIPPTLPETGGQNLEIARQLGNWVVETGNGKAFDSSTGFTMPITGSRLSPDVSWVPSEWIPRATRSEGAGFPRLCPDFVVELRSKWDALKPLLDKMEEYRQNGARLGWVIDPSERKVYVFHADEPVRVLTRPASVSGDPVLPGFVLNLTLVWG